MTIVFGSKIQEMFYPLKFQMQLYVPSVTTSSKSAFPEIVHVHFSHNSHANLYVSYWLFPLID